ncbi:MAG: asparaginase [Candidatus Caldatribacteriota bacterium]|nr:asparaginase [Candidatus Caldatribacteriota bacterium]
MPKLAKVYRGKIVESSHSGHIAIVNSNGKLLKYLGNPCRITYAHSAIKPIQQYPF